MLLAQLQSPQKGMTFPASFSLPLYQPLFDAHADVVYMGLDVRCRIATHFVGCDGSSSFEDLLESLVYQLSDR